MQAFYDLIKIEALRFLSWRTPCQLRNYSAAAADNVSMTAIFGSRFDGRPCRSFRYFGLLDESQTFPGASSETRILRGRARALLGAANMRGVPPFRLPKISSFVGGIFIPTFAASPL